MENNELQEYAENEDKMLENDLQYAENSEVEESEVDDLPATFEDKRNLLAKTKILKQTWSIREIFIKIDKKDLILSPDYQRRAIWTIDKQTAFIESIFMDIVIPPIYVVEIPEKNMLEGTKYEVVDGKQRLTAIFDFVKNEFKLKKNSLEYFADLFGDLKFTEIERSEYDSYVKNLLSSVLDIYVISANSPEFVKYDIFSRLNKGAEPLRVNEIRKAIYRSSTLEDIEKFVKEYSEDSLNQTKYSKVFSGAGIKRFEDYGRFYRSLAFYLKSDKENKTIRDYNSRPRDMINNVLGDIQQRRQSIEKDELLKILNFTIDFYIWLKETPIESNRIGHIIDACVPFVQEISNFNIFEDWLVSDILEETFIKSPSTTKNVDARFGQVCDLMLSLQNV